MRVRDIVSENFTGDSDEAKSIVQKIKQKIKDLNEIPGLSGMDFDDDDAVPTEPKQLTPLQQQRQVGHSGRCKCSIQYWRAFAAFAL